MNVGEDFQTALNTARPGDVITLEAGATFVGPFTLPNKPGADWIVIRTSAPDGNLPPPGTRVGAQIVKAFRAGDLDRARFWARCYALFPGKWAAYGLPPVMKSAMKHFGVDIGNPCRPYAPVSPRDHAQIGQFLRQVGLIGEAGPTPQALLDAQDTLRQEDTFLR